MNFQKKTPKREKIDTSPYSYYKYDDRENIVWESDYIQVVAVDPATDNFAFRIERRYRNGEVTCLAFEIAKFRREKDGDTNVMIYDLISFLDKHSKLYRKTHIFMIERQMVPNHLAIIISHHCISYFMSLARQSKLVPMIVEVDPKVKGKMLSAPKGINYTYLKKWAVEKALEILHENKDEKSIEIISSKRKKDDLCDTVIMIEAMFILWSKK